MELDANDGMRQTLEQARDANAPVEAQLRGGHVLKGRVIAVGCEFAVIGPLAGRDFSDAKLRIADIAALCIQVRGNEGARPLARPGS